MCDTLRLQDNRLWHHSSGSYFLTLDPAYTYNADGQDARDCLQAFVPREDDRLTDLFCFSTVEQVWKYYGIFACVGSQKVTFQQAKEKLHIPEKVCVILYTYITESDCIIEDARLGKETTDLDQRITT